MLDHFIRGMICSASDDPGLITSLVLLDGNRILAHIFEPDVFESASSSTVNALSLVFADDDILKSCSGLEKEYGIRVTW